MPRHRLGVVLLFDEYLSTMVDGLRLACDDGARHRIAPHVTLVPPVNVRVDEIGTVLALMRDAASSITPLTLNVGPPDTFLPRSAVLYLQVRGEDAASAALSRLRARLFVPPLDRKDPLPFVPHVTIANEMSPERIEAALAALAGFEVTTTVDRIHLLRHEEGGDHRGRWVPIADVPLGPRRVVGRGGVELEITVTRLADPEVIAFERRWSDEVGATPTAMVVTARARGEVVGVLRGEPIHIGLPSPDTGRRDRPVGLGSILVAGDRRGQGIARQLIRAFEHERDRSALT